MKTIGRGKGLSLTKSQERCISEFLRASGPMLKLVPQILRRSRTALIWCGAYSLECRESSLLVHRWRRDLTKTDMLRLNELKQLQANLYSLAKTSDTPRPRS